MIRRLSALAFALIAAPALAQPTADLGAIDAAVAGFLGAPLGAPGGAALPVDRRLRLTACTTPLALGWFGTQRDTVEVSCRDPGGWKLYVPLANSTSRQLGSSAPVAAAPPLIARGDAVTIALTGDGFEVDQGGEALEAGAAGAWIKVRGLGAGAATMRARVIGPGSVGIAVP